MLMLSPDLRGFFGRLLMPEVVSKLKKLWSEGFKVSCLLRDDVI